MSISGREQLLADIGMCPQKRELLQKCLEQKQTSTVIRLLRQHRATLLETIQTNQNRLYCLGWLLDNMEEEK